MRNDGNASKVLTGKPTVKIPLRRYWRRYEDSIRINLKEMGVYMRNWTNFAKGRNYWSPCEWSIKPPGSLSQGVSLI